MDQAFVDEFWKDKKRGFLGEIIASPLVRASKPFLKKGGWVLDAGAGTGALLRELRRLGIAQKYVGIDYIERPELDVAKGDVTNLQFSDSTFSNVFCIEVLEHLDSKQLYAALREIHRVLELKGILVITVPFDEDLEGGNMVCPRCGHRFHPWLHQQSFDLARIKGVLESTGFNIQHLRPQYFQTQGKIELFLPIFSRVILPVGKLILRNKKRPEGIICVAQKTEQ
jgi:ubiquinone/menaquinone biosynthesis C-methylase UbiE